MTEKPVPAALEPEPASAVSQTDAITSAIVRHVIIRACDQCQHSRVVGEPCAGCGNEAPPKVENLGVTNASYRNPVQAFIWRVIGDPLSRLRIRQANASAEQLRIRAVADREG